VKFIANSDLKGVSAYRHELANLPAPPPTYYLIILLQVKAFLASAHNIWKKVQGKARRATRYVGADY
jgi:hypothetical protein